ncbi:MAG: hypothetical protein LBF57_02345 [Holosporaceae bacterium]|nr:hypothetical protein [Holosporaceae bacterium]
MHITKIINILAIIGVVCSLFFSTETSQQKQKNILPTSAKKIKRTEEYVSPEPFPELVNPMNVREVFLSSREEEEYYFQKTWDPLKTLEQNRRILVDSFMKNCVDSVVDFLHTDKGLILVTKSQPNGMLLQSADVEEFRTRDIVEVIYLMTDSPIFCRLVRALLTKYKTLRYRPQKAVFLYTKGEANHASYDIIHHVLNLRISDLEVLSAFDCTKHKLRFGATVFHEMLHWYHKVCDLESFVKRSKSTSCIQKHFLESHTGFFFMGYKDIALKGFSNDEEYLTIYGLKEDYNGELVIDSLSEASYTYEQYGYIRGSHTVFTSFSDEKHFILSTRDPSLLKLFQTKEYSKFGKGEFKCAN